MTKTYLAPAALAQVVKDAEKTFVARGGDLAALRAKQERAMARDRADTEDDFDTYHARDVLGDTKARNVERATTEAQRSFDVAAPSFDVPTYTYRVQATTALNAIRAARDLQAAAGLPPFSRNVRVRLASKD